MSNLGNYQRLVQLAKKVGGPKRLVGLLLLGGSVLGKAAGVGRKKAVRAISARMAAASTDTAAKGQVFGVTFDGEVDGVKVRVGDQFRVLEGDRDAILIEVLGDADNPYVVSSTFLRSVSDYPNEPPTER